MTTTAGVKLGNDTRNRLKALGEIRERSPHWLMRTAIEEYLEREEAFEKEKQEDQKRWEAYQSSGLAISHNKVAQRLRDLTQGKA